MFSLLLKDLISDFYFPSYNCICVLAEKCEGHSSTFWTKMLLRTFEGRYAEEQIRSVFDDNWRIIFVSSPLDMYVGGAILMSTHNKNWRKLSFYTSIP